MRCPTSPSLYKAARVGEGVRGFEADIRDLAAVDRACAESRPEVILHMAAHSLVGRSFTSPVETCATSVMGTVHVLEAARRSEAVRAVVVVTSDKCYENREWIWGYREHERMGGADPYSSSKGCAELVASAYRRSFAGPAIASARAGNVIGGGDWAKDRLIPDVMTAALDGRAAAIRNPDAIRPWQHVLNPLSGYLMLAQALWEPDEHADGWNFGHSDQDARPVRWLLARLSEVWGERLEWERAGGENPHEAQQLKVDSAKTRTRLGWTPCWGLEDALVSIAAWYVAVRRAADLRAVALEQIAAFEAGAPPPRGRTG